MRGFRFAAFVISLNGVVLGSESAQAEQSEVAVGVEGGLMLPALASQDVTAFRLTTFGVGGFARYGLFDDLGLALRLDVSLFRAATAESRAFQGRTLEGVRYLRAEQYNVSAGGRYKLVSGYNLAPYIEGYVGVMWTVLREQQYLSPTGEDFGVAVPDEGQGAWTAEVGLSADYRLFDMGFVGLAVRWSEVFGHTLYRRFVTVPVEISYYW